MRARLPAAPHTAFDPPHAETRASFWLLASVLMVLGCAKAAAHVAYVGPVVLTFAAFWQLRAPLWRVERAGFGPEALGCHLGAWRLDLASTAALALGILPLYACGYHLMATQGASIVHAVCPGLGFGAIVYHPIWHMPQNPEAWARSLLWFAERVVTHTFGVALPEELFYRGYLQPLWQARWASRYAVWGAPMGWATLGVCAAFALGHWLGEWQIGRLGPFFPSLLFAWQRARSGTIVGCVGLHALCNLFAEVWVRQYAPGA